MKDTLLILLLIFSVVLIPVALQLNTYLCYASLSGHALTLAQVEQLCH